MSLTLPSLYPSSVFKTHTELRTSASAPADAPSSPVHPSPGSSATPPPHHGGWSGIKHTSAHGSLGRPPCESEQTPGLCRTWGPMRPALPVFHTRPPPLSCPRATLAAWASLGVLEDVKPTSPSGRTCSLCLERASPRRPLQVPWPSSSLPQAFPAPGLSWLALPKLPTAPGTVFTVSLLSRLHRTCHWLT